MPPRTETGGRKRKRIPPPTRTDKAAVVWAAEQNLKPWEVAVAPPKPPGKRVEQQKDEELEHRYRVALAAPVSARARQRLAATMTPERRKQQIESYKPPRPPRDGGLLHTVEHAGSAVGRAAAEAAGAVERAAKYRVTHEPSPGEVLHGLRRAGEVGLGIDIRRFAHPREALKADAAVRAANERAFARWSAAHPGGDPAQFLKQHPDVSAGTVPWFGPLRGVLSRAGELGGPARAVADIVEAAPPEAPKRMSVEEAHAAIRKAIPAEKGQVEAQEALRSAERARRIATHDVAYEDAGGGLVGHFSAKAKLAGEYPRLQSKLAVAGIPEEAVGALLDTIHAYPGLYPFQKVAVRDALLNALQGKTVQRAQLQRLEQVFGKQETQEFIEAGREALTKWQKAYKVGREVAAVPRAVQSAYDLSFLFRQALLGGSRHPLLFLATAKDIPRFLTKKGYEAELDALVNRIGYQRAEEAGLALTEVGKSTLREDQFTSTYAERLIPGVGVSSRAYTAFLNSFRAKVFDHLADHVQQAAYLDGRDPKKALNGLARVVNASTGRGGLWKGEKAASELATIFFSPRLIASRLAFLNPVWYARLPPGARKEAVTTGLAFLFGVLMPSLAVAKAAGADVGLDPTSANFLKIRKGNTRVDLTGGLQPLVRFFAQIASGVYTSSTTGKPMRLGSGDFGQMTRADIRNRLIWSKLAPVPATIEDWMEARTITGQKLNWKNEGLQRITPLLAQDIYSVYQQTGSIPAAAGLGALAATGVGVQSYSARTPTSRAKPRLPYSSGNRGGVPLPFSGGGRGVPLPFSP